MKGTFHKSCSCRMCRLGRGSEAGKATRNANERKLRRAGKKALAEVVKGEEDVVIGPISSPYTD